MEKHSQHEDNENYTIPIKTHINPITPQAYKNIKYKLIDKKSYTNSIPLLNLEYNQQNNVQNIQNDDVTISSETFYSVQSEIPPVIVDVKQEKNFDKKIKNQNFTIKQPMQQLKLLKNTDHVISDTINYELEKEYKEMKEYIEENQFDKIRELDQKILRKEIKKRKEENKERLENLKRIEQKLSEENNRMAMSESQFQFKAGNNYDLVNSLFIPNVLNSNKKVDLVLANVEKGGGYRVLPQTEFNIKYDAVPFGGYVFYQKKGNNV